MFPNDDGRIVPGLFARIRVPLSERHPALLVDERAIGTDQAQKFVLTLTPTNTVPIRPSNSARSLTASASFAPVWQRAKKSSSTACSASVPECR